MFKMSTTVTLRPCGEIWEKVSFKIVIAHMDWTFALIIGLIKYTQPHDNVTCLMENVIYKTNVSKEISNKGIYQRYLKHIEGSTIVVFQGIFECSLVRKDKNEKNSSAVTTVITAFWADVFEEKALKERKMGNESTTSTSRANIKGLTVLFHFASSSDSLLLPQPNLISCCSCSSVYSLTSLLFPFVLSSDLIHICHRDYTRWTDIRDQLWDGSEGCLLLSTTSVRFDLFSVDLMTADVSSFSFLVAAALTGRRITILNLPKASCPFI